MVGRSTRSLWGKAKELVKGSVVAKVVDEMWTYLYKNTRAFYKWAFSIKSFGQTSCVVLANIAYIGDSAVTKP